MVDRTVLLFQIFTVFFFDILLLELSERGALKSHYDREAIYFSISFHRFCFMNFNAPY